MPAHYGAARRATRPPHDRNGGNDMHQRTTRVLHLASVVALIGGLVIAPTAPTWAIPEGPADGTPEWTQRESTNYARTSEAPNEQASNPQFQLLWNTQSQANHQEWVDRALADPSWLGPPSGNSEVTPLS